MLVYIKGGFLQLVGGESNFWQGEASSLDLLVTCLLVVMLSPLACCHCRDAQVTLLPIETRTNIPLQSPRLFLQKKIFFNFLKWRLRYFFLKKEIEFMKFFKIQIFFKDLIWNQFWMKFPWNLKMSKSCNFLITWELKGQFLIIFKWKTNCIKKKLISWFSIMGWNLGVSWKLK